MVHWAVAVKGHNRSEKTNNMSSFCNTPVSVGGSCNVASGIILAEKLLVWLLNLEAWRLFLTNTVAEDCRIKWAFHVWHAIWLPQICDVFQPDLTRICNHFTRWLIRMKSYVVNRTKMQYWSPVPKPNITGVKANRTKKYEFVRIGHLLK